MLILYKCSYINRITFNNGDVFNFNDIDVFGAHNIHSYIVLSFRLYYSAVFS